MILDVCNLIHIQTNSMHTIFPLFLKYLYVLFKNDPENYQVNIFLISLNQFLKVV